MRERSREAIHSLIEIISECQVSKGEGKEVHIFVEFYTKSEVGEGAW